MNPLRSLAPAAAPSTTAPRRDPQTRGGTPLAVLAAALLAAPPLAAAADPPDLAPTALAVTTSPAVAGYHVDVSHTVTRTGDEIPTTWGDYIYLSTDATFDGHANETFLATVSNNNSDDSYTLLSTVVLPKVAPGTYHLFVVVDGTEWIAESNESNNVLGIPLVITAPDLLPLSAAFTNTPVAGAWNNLQVVIRNNGAPIPLATTEWSDRIYLSDDAVWNAGQDTYLMPIESRGPLAAGTDYSATAAVPIPDKPPGNYFLIVRTDTTLQVHEGDESNNVIAFPVTLVTPNFQPASAGFTSLAYAGKQAELNYTVNNDGTGPALDGFLWGDQVWLSGDQTLDTNDTLLAGPIKNGPVAANSSYSHTQTVNLPVVPTGDYYLIVSTDHTWDLVHESNESDNIAAYPITIVSPNLRPTVAEFTTTPSAGAFADLSLTVANDGNGPLAAGASWWDRIYLSADNSLNPAEDTLLATAQKTGPVPANGSYTTQLANVYLPNVAPGPYHLIVATDDISDLIFEINEADNVAAYPVTIVSPNLRPTAASFTGTASAGHYAQMTFTVANQGNGSTPSTVTWYDNVYLSEDATLDPADRLLVSSPRLGAVAGGTDYSPTANVVVPETAPGAYFLLVSTDHIDDHVHESNETDNVAAYPVTVVAPDLRPLSASFSTLATSGEAAQLEVSITNEGTGPAIYDGHWWDNIYLSADNVIDTGDTLLWRPFRDGPVPPGGGFSNGTQVVIPAVPRGDYFLIVSCDHDLDLVFEGDETDNIAAFPVTIGQPDLRPTAAGFAGGPGRSGEQNTLQFTVTNQGDGHIGPSRTWYDVAYLSNDNVFDANDTLLVAYTAASGPVSVGAPYQRSVNCNVPQRQPGNYFVILIADDNWNYLTESDEPNNVQAFPVTLTAPNLRPVAASFRDNAAAPGRNATIDIAIRNTGFEMLTLRGWYDSVYLSADNALDAGDIPLASQLPAFTPLGANADYQHSRTVLLPQVAPGPYFLIVSADDSFNYLIEDDEIDNAQAFPVTISAPDLAPTAIVAGGPTVAGFSVEVTVTTTNQGGAAVAAAEQWDDHLYFSTDNVFDGGDTLLAGPTEITGPLPVAGTYQRVHTVTIPRTAVGTCYLIARAETFGDLPEASESNNLLAVPIEATRVNLTPVALALPGGNPLVPGQPATVDFEVANQGDGPRPANPPHADAVYLSNDAVLSAGDTLVGGPWSENDPLPADQSYLRSRSITLGNTPSGTRYLLLVSDSGDSLFESNENDNVRPLQVQVTGMPDLEPVALTVASGTPDSGASITVDYSVRNNALDPIPSGAQPWADRFYLSADATFDAGDTLLATAPEETPPLAANTTYSRTLPLTLPTLAEGPWHLLLVADGRANEVAEATETNNTFAFAFHVGPAPDLAPTTVVAGGPTVAGFPVAVTVTTANQGSAAVPAGAAWQDHLYFSTDQVLDAGDIPLAGPTAAGAPLGVAATYQNVHNVTIPQSATGTCYLIAAADTGATLAESSESNNRLAVAIEATRVDLAPVALALAGGGPLVVGQAATVNLEIANQGNGPLPAGHPYNNALYLSTDAALGAEDVLLGGPWQEDSAVPASGSYTRSPEVTATGLSSGSYFLLLVTDAGNTVFEGDESDNLLAVAVQVQAKPDLQPTALTVNTGVPGSGSSISLAYTVRNNGPDQIATGAQPWADRFYLSADATFDAGDTLLATAPEETPPLAANTNYSRTLPLTLPTLTEGTWHILLVADGRANEVAEASETNNTLALAFDVESAPDLAPTTVVVGGPTVAGFPVAVTVTTANQGSAAVPAGAAWQDHLYFSTDQVLDAGDIPLAGPTAAGAPLGVAATYQNVHNVTIPQSASGTCYLIAAADTGATLAESSESNNRLAVAIEATRVDLAPVALALAGGGPLVVGQAATVNLEIANQGNGPLPAGHPYHNALYLSTDAALGAEDVLLGGPWQENSDVPASGSYIRSPEVIVSGSSSGSYFLLLITDTGNAVFEGDESDNLLAVPVQVQAKPDLQPTALTVNTGVPGSGASISLAYTVRNNGPDPIATGAQPWADRFHLSADATLDAGDTLLATAPDEAPPLAANADYSRTLPLTLPTITPGTWHILLVADGRANEVNEASETNNTRALQFTIGTSFDSWAAANNLTGDDALPGANPLRDGINNELKYAFGLNPNTAYGPDRYLTPGTGTSGLPSITVTAEPRLQIEFVRRRDAADLTYQVRFGSDPAAMTPVTIPAGVPIDAQWERVVILDADAPANAPRRFGCVTVTVN